MRHQREISILPTIRNKNTMAVALDVLGISSLEVEKATGLSRSYISQIRRGHKPMSKKLRRDLRVLIDDTLDQMEEDAKRQPKLKPVGDLVAFVEKLL